MHITLRTIGNSQGIVLRKPARSARTGWADAAQAVAAAGNDAHVMGELGNEAVDEGWAW
jgi:antitoxin MazE